MTRWEPAFFSGYKLRDGFRQVTFYHQPDNIQLIHSQDILSSYDFFIQQEREEQRHQLEQERVKQIEQEKQQILQQECNDFFDTCAQAAERKYLDYFAEWDSQNFDEINKQHSTAVDEQIIEQNAKARNDGFAPENRQCDPVLAPVRHTVEDTSNVLLHGEDQCDPELAPVHTTVEDMNAVLLHGPGGISSITTISFITSTSTPGLLQVPAAGGILVQQPGTNCSEISMDDHQLRAPAEVRQARIACGKRLLQKYRASKSLNAITQVHQAGGTSTLIPLGIGVGVTSTATLRTGPGPYSGVSAAHPLLIYLGEPPTTAGTSAAIPMVGPVCAGVDSFSTAGINAALPPRTGIGVHPPTASLSTAKLMAGSASAGDTNVVYDFAADNPDNPFAFTAVYNASRG